MLSVFFCVGSPRMTDCILLPVVIIPLCSGVISCSWTGLHELKEEKTRQGWYKLFICILHFTFSPCSFLPKVVDWNILYPLFFSLCSSDARRFDWQVYFRRVIKSLQTEIQDRLWHSLRILILLSHVDHLPVKPHVVAMFSKLCTLKMTFSHVFVLIENTFGPDTDLNRCCI